MRWCLTVADPLSAMQPVDPDPLAIDQQNVGKSTCVSLLRTIKAEADISLLRSVDGKPFLGFDYSSIDLEPWEAELWEALDG